MRQRTRPGAVVLVTAGALIVSGCGSSNASSAQANGARLAPTIAADATLSMTSPATLTDTYRDTISAYASAPSCMAAAAGFIQDGPRFVVPQNPQSIKVQGGDGRAHAITLTLHVAGYHGPGTYPKGNVVGDTSQQLALVDGVAYGIANGGNVILTVSPDGSGTLVLDGLTLAPPPPPAPTDPPSPGTSPVPATPAPPPPAPGSVPPLSAKLSWQCVQTRTPALGGTPPPTSAAAPMPTPAPTPAPAPKPTPTPKR